MSNSATDEYMEGAWKFLQEMKKRKVDAKKFLCPCKECRNMRHYDIQTIYEHLIIKGMDPTYNVWYYHGEVCEEDDVEKEVDDALMLEATILYKSTYIEEEDKNGSFTSRKTKIFLTISKRQTLHCTPDVQNNTKISAVVALYKLKTYNGW